MKKSIKVFLCFMCMLMIVGIGGCSSSKNTNVEETLLKANYWIDATESGVAIKKYYEGEGMRCWAYTDKTKSNLSFSDDCLFDSLSIDPKNGTVDKETLEHFEYSYNIKISDNTVNEIKKFADKELSKMNITYDQLLEYMKYKMDKEPSCVGDDNKAKINSDDIPKSLMSSKEQLKIKYSAAKTTIDKLSDTEANKYANYLKKYPESTFVEIQEKVILNDSDIPSEIPKIVNELKDKSRNATTDWEIKNFRIQETDTVVGVRYDWYLKSKDTNIDFIFLYNPNKNVFNGVCLNADDAKFNVDDVEDILVIYMVLMQCVDESIDATTALNIANRCYNKNYHHNGWIYNISLDDDLTMMIVPK